MEVNQFTLLASLAKEIKSEKKDRAKIVAILASIKTEQKNC